MKHTSYETVEAAHPGYKAIAGPFAHNHKTPSVRTAERAACYRTVKDHEAQGVKTVVKIHDGKAWVLRTAEGWKRRTHDERGHYKDASGGLARARKNR